MALPSKYTLFHRPPLLPSWRSVRAWFAHYFGGLIGRIEKHHIFLNAGGLAFSLFVCVVPMVLILFSGLGVVLERSRLENEIANWIDRAIPYQQYTAQPKEFIFSRIEEFKLYRKVAGLVGVVGLFFAASSLFSSMRTILNEVFATSISKHALIGKLRDFGMVLLVMAYFLFSVMVLPALGVVTETANHIRFLQFLEVGFMEEFIVFLFSFLVMYVAFWSMYYFVPYAKMERRVISVSAFWATVLWEAAKQGFSLYIRHGVTLPAVYGTYLFFIVVVFWIYYSSMVFIFGAEIGQLYRERRERRSDW